VEGQPLDWIGNKEISRFLNLETKKSRKG